MSKFFIVLFVIFLSGCGGNPTAMRSGEMANNNLYKSRSPVRVDVKILEGGGAILSQVWAGEKGISIIDTAEETIKNDVWKLFTENCGFSKSDLREVRIVEHKHPFFYEVWIFDDQKSKRKDGQSGISLILNVSATSGTDITLVGGCHS